MGGNVINEMIRFRDPEMEIGGNMVFDGFTVWG